ncbi:hypothetical protein ACERII_16345 [Evansella sp. AB-rgal1]|uniref:hypothetical protein n=1 Tax=Evansella sp. AB-rgal1 TaxID=3242696 RepID=UPI00359DA4C6
MSKYIFAVGIIVSLAYFLSSIYLAENIYLITEREEVYALYEEDLITTFEEQRVDFTIFNNQMTQLIQYYESMLDALSLYNEYASKKELSTFLADSIGKMEKIPSLIQGIPSPQGFRKEEEEDFADMKTNLTVAFQYLNQGFEEYIFYKNEGRLEDESNFQFLWYESKIHFSKVKLKLEKYQKFFHHDKDVSVDS